MFLLPLTLPDPLLPAAGCPNTAPDCKALNVDSHYVIIKLDCIYSTSGDSITPAWYSVRLLDASSRRQQELSAD